MGRTGDAERIEFAEQLVDPLDEIFGAPVTTRNWNTIVTLRRILTDAQ